MKQNSDVDATRGRQELKEQAILTTCYALEHLSSLTDEQFSAIEELVKMERLRRGLTSWRNK